MTIVSQDPLHVSLGLFVGWNAVIAIDGSWTGVIRCECACHITVAIEHQAEVARTAVDVFVCEKWCSDTELFRGGGHELHEALGAHS